MTTIKMQNRITGGSAVTSTFGRHAVAAMALSVLCATAAHAGVLDGATTLDAAKSAAAGLDAAQKAALPALAKGEDAHQAADALMLIALLDEQHELDALAALRGVNPDVYLQYRRPEPVVGNEIADAGYHPGALLLAHRFPAAFIQARAASDYPAWAEQKVATFQQKERVAFETGVVVALARSPHAVAHDVLVGTVMDKNRGEVLRATVATMLGESGAADASRVLSDIALDAAMPQSVRSAAIVGLGKTRDGLAFTTLRTVVQSKNAARRDVAIRAIGNLGSKWAHTSAPTVESERLRRDASALLIETLPQVVGTKAAKGIATSLATIAHPTAQAQLAALAQRHTDARLQDDIRYAERLVQRALSR